MTEGAAETSPRRTGAGRPRDAALDKAILAAALNEIVEHGIAAFSSVAVARRAGVAKNTVYLRWPRRDELLKAALLQGGDNPTPPPVTGDLRVDLLALADEFAASFGSEMGLVAYYQLSVTSRTDPAMWAWAKANIIDPAHDIPERVIRAAQHNGTARSDVNAGVAARLLAGGIFAEAILQTPHGYVSAEFREQLVETLMAVLGNEQSFVK